MRGAFSPWLHLAQASLALRVAFWLALSVYGVGLTDPAASWARYDSRLAPIAFAVGLLAGHLVGRKRLGLLRRVWPELEGKFFLTESGALDRYGSDASFIQLQRSTYAWTVVVALGLAAYSVGKFQSWASPAAFIAGVLVAGKTVPMLRLWTQTTAPARTYGRIPALGR